MREAENPPADTAGDFIINSDRSDQSCFWALIFTPGPMVEAVTQERMYWPFALAGLALMIAPMRAV